MIKPDISVCLITYNHGKYIEECLQSVLNQKGNFQIEILIGDDGSTDNTTEVCRKFALKYPDKIKHFCWDRKDVIYYKGRPTGRRNFLNLIDASQGKYIAVIEGDDYWCDENKLQKQFDFLEQHPEVVLCHHWQYYAVYDREGKYKVVPAPKEGQGYLPDQFTDVKVIFEDKLRCKSRTMLFRNHLGQFPEWYKEVAYGDVPLTFILGKHGKFGFLDEPMAVYRQTGTGYSSQGKGQDNFILTRFLEWIRIWEIGDSYFDFKYHREAKGTIRKFCREIYQRNNGKKEALKGILRYFRNESVGKRSYRFGMRMYAIYCYLFVKKNG